MLTFAASTAVCLLSPQLRAGCDPVGESGSERRSRIRWKKKQKLPLAEYLPALRKKSPELVLGTAAFLTSRPDLVPTAQRRSLKHNKLMHRRNIIV